MDIRQKLYRGFKSELQCACHKFYLPDNYKGKYQVHRKKYQSESFDQNPNIKTVKQKIFHDNYIDI
jgi:hypothetical protein